MILDEVKFTKLVTKKRILPSLKSYADTLLFYYLGHLATKNNNNPILEIGVGGSTYVLSELSENNTNLFYIVDADYQRLYEFTEEKKFFPNTNTQKLLTNSNNLDKFKIGNLSYVHLDGDKDYRMVKNDLDFAVSKLAPMGLICQDDYGNNKWPTITSAVHTLINENVLEILFVGDSSVWLTNKEDHAKWIAVLRNDSEFNILSKFLNVGSSNTMSSPTPEYLFMNFFKNNFSSINYIEYHQYYKTLICYNNSNYLQLPYKMQSQLGRAINQKWYHSIISFWHL